MPGTLAWQWPGLGDACQSGMMSTLFNSLFFVSKISFLPNFGGVVPTRRVPDGRGPISACQNHYGVKYYDYIVK